MESKSLWPGYILHGRTYTYRIERVLGQGTFGITYLGTTTIKIDGPLGELETTLQVAIKEFFMREINDRSEDTVTGGSRDGIFTNYKHKFMREAQNLSRLKEHHHIVNVLEFFEANNTAYYVMEYVPGGNLDEYIRMKGSLSEEESVRLAGQIGSALSYMHQHNMLHLDMKPGNVMLRNNGDVVLIDFGLSKQYDDSGCPDSTTSIGGGTPGYSPLEQSQYKEGVGFPVTMDVYALGATIFKMVTGTRPPEATIILNEGEGFVEDELLKHRVGQKLRHVIAKSMSIRHRDRYQSIGEMVSELLENDLEQTMLYNLEQTSLYEDSRFFRQKNPQTKGVSSAFETISVNGVSFKMIKVDGGTFTMGATPEQGLEAEDNEKPAHQVTLSDYWIGETEVTQELWMAVMGTNPSYFKGNPKNPVDIVTWYDIVNDFLPKLNQLTGKNFTLPTEAQWEFAARGGNKSQGYKYSGSNDINAVARYEDNSGGQTHPVAEKRPNELGLYDMSGNVDEWCRDWYGYYSSDVQTNPTGPSSGAYRVLRGGYFRNEARDCRVSLRIHCSPDGGSFGSGIRLVLQ